MGNRIEWNDDLKLILSDVDETIADLYMDAEPEMCEKLESLLREGKVLFLISGQGIKSIRRRIINHINPKFRRKIIVGHCSGSEVWGFDENGNLKERPFYSLYNSLLTEHQKHMWRKVINQLIKEFNLEVYPTMPVSRFKEKVGDNPLAIMLEDRGPQITFEVINGYNLEPYQISRLGYQMHKVNDSYDLRIFILERAKELFKQNNLPITPRLAGVFAIDFVVKGVSKSTAVKWILNNEGVLAQLGLSKEIISNPHNLEVWGDKFSVVKGGTDRYISEALPKQVRSISFRKENPEEFPRGYNIVVWNGKEHLHHGLLEFLRSRRS